MNKELIRLTESDLHKIVEESAKRIMKEVALKGKSGKTYSLHGTDPESWAVMSRVRGKNSYIPNTPQHYHACRDEDNWIELDDKAHPNLRSRKNANRINAMMNRIDDKSKDIMAANESKLSRIVKESVNRILNEIGDTAKGQYMLGRLQGRQMGNGNRQQAMNTQNYASKQLGSRTPQNFQTYDAAETANQMGYNDERNPQHSQDIMTNGGSIGNYQANVRNNYLRGVSKF